MTITPRRYEAKKIVDRALSLGIFLSAANGAIRVKLPKGLGNPEKILSVIRDHKEELLLYLLKDCCACGMHVESDQGIGEYSEAGQYRCSACLSVHQLQQPEPSPAKEDLRRIATQIAADLPTPSPAGDVSIFHMSDLAAVKQSALDELRHRIAVEGDDAARTPDDFWRQTRARVEAPPIGLARAEWKSKLEELRAWRPGDEQFAHLGGYAAYCRMYRVSP